MECQSAVHRLHRERRLSSDLVDQALRQLTGLVEEADVVDATALLRERAGRLLTSHALRAADALQLAAALIWCDETPRDETFVCLDTRLREAARREGFGVLPQR